jgi:glyoxylase-like metal-dependent hydrolase (beta-lactamase superfamily II)
MPEPMRGRSVQAYLLPGSVPTLVDCGLGFEGARSSLEMQMAEVGFKLSELRRLVITHAHIDHLGLAKDVHDRSGCEIAAHPRCLPMLADFAGAWRGRLELHRRAAKASGVPAPLIDAFSAHFLAKAELGPQGPIESSALRALGEGDRIRAGDSAWRVAHLPGHTADHIALVNAGSKSAITGDLLLRHLPTIPFLEGRAADGRRPRALSDLIASWRRLGRMQLEICFTGHGQPIRAHRVLIARRLADLRRRLTASRAALTEGASCIWEVACALGPEAPGPASLQPRLGETIALLDWLVERERASRGLEGDILRYRLR